MVPKAPVEPSVATFSEGVRAASQKLLLPVVELVVLALVPPAPPVTVVAKLPVLELVTAVVLELPALEVAEPEVREPEIPVFEVPVSEVALLDAVELAVVVALNVELALMDASPEVATLLVVSGRPVVKALVVPGLAVVAILVAELSVELAPPVLETRSEPVTVPLVATGSSTTVAQAKTRQAQWMTSKPGIAQRERNESWWLVTPWSS